MSVGAAPVSEQATRGTLSCVGITVHYGGLVALDGVDLSIESGATVGLIGPNGSGKSTFLNVVSGAQRSHDGTVLLGGARIDRLTIQQRARLGIARTFQTLRLFDNLSVLENVLLGAHHLYRSPLWLSPFYTPQVRRERKARVEAAVEILSVFGSRLVPRLDEQVIALSYANRRRVELARAMMAQPVLVLLDEPSAGMNPAETDELAEQVSALSAATGCSVLVVEHKMDFIGALCSRVYVLDHGACLAEGPPDEVRDDPRVAEAFLGVE